MTTPSTGGGDTTATCVTTRSPSLASFVDATDTFNPTTSGTDTRRGSRGPGTRSSKPLTMSSGSSAGTVVFGPLQTADEIMWTVAEGSCVAEAAGPRHICPSASTAFGAAGRRGGARFGQSVPVAEALAQGGARWACSSGRTSTWLRS